MPNNPNAVKNLIPFKPGKSGNPNGRPKDVPNTKTRLQRLLQYLQNIENPITGEMEGFTVAEQMDLQQVLKALKGDHKSYEMLLDRLEGKPTVDISSKDGTMTPTVIIGDSYSATPKFRPDNTNAGTDDVAEDSSGEPSKV